MWKIFDQSKLTIHVLKSFKISLIWEKQKIEKIQNSPMNTIKHQFKIENIQRKNQYESEKFNDLRSFNQRNLSFFFSNWYQEFSTYRFEL